VACGKVASQSGGARAFPSLAKFAWLVGARVGMPLRLVRVLRLGVFFDTEGAGSHIQVVGVNGVNGPHRSLKPGRM
jgi:hypothetical protein